MGGRRHGAQKLDAVDMHSSHPCTRKYLVAAVLALGTRPSGQNQKSQVMEKMALAETQGVEQLREAESKRKGIVGNRCSAI